MATDWREFGRDLTDELVNKVFASARLVCEIDLLTTGGGDWQTGGSSVSQTFVGFAIRTDLDKTQFDETNAQVADFAVKIRASEVPFKVRKDNQVMRIESKDAATDVSLGLIDAEILDAAIDPVDAMYTVLGRYK
ncbi:MAG TPA: hypothetical protein EYN54_00635 [Methylococcaceae bacterium]|nr:hypothetical protein [Methylococcaceae bacterium]